MFKTITISVVYYNQDKEIILRHLNNWKSFPVNVKNSLSFQFIDNNSKISLKEILNLEDLTGLDATIYQIKEDMNNIADVRNFGAKNCKTPWYLPMNMNTILPLKTARRLLALSHKHVNTKKKVYTFKGQVVNNEQHEKHLTVLSGIYFLKTEDYWDIGENYNHKVDYFDSGIKIRNIQDSRIKATAEMSTNYDHVFVVVGDNSLRYTWEGGKSFQKTAGENKARSFLGLPGKQLDLVKSIYEKNKNLTVVYVSGKPISEPWIEDNIKSIIHAWEPGSMGGKSLAKIIFGE